ncbi:16S rRNA (adenine(1518)-N(6)/adenine(1519)-N(6))-dimethyltransferase RsmA [Candidatus Nitronereus thalassa]|uniref:Ribosomal RNA small subunit methyltransferase A n=1 Tax=Candidatus Nitronereus thalassa TaxID=3020898 RepID=A0ABU3K898_9BACT|nr:16S rRNA (adenine(1518)-N(6)/adenine(1519)-N(6))-dimethyltransferase RsmA [Candidatus Nitronereus thalassa]MDT7042642.1 16S rRNA (adenine(1518)-N(6)/adenine(1519)-N(6))-dimethyltransferase RsmA [Candidatus Nitronereus thalassa]
MTIPSPPPPLKRLGQHFLIDPNIVRKIIHEAAISPEDTVLEIGPGRGVLTGPLCELASQVIAIELDKKLAAYLKQVCPYPNLDLKVGDALEFPVETLPPGTVVVANLPYYVSTPLLFQLLEQPSRINRMIVMLQLEVAKRLAAKPGSQDYGALSVLSQYRGKSRVAFKVPASCFRPRPDVESAVVTLSLFSGEKEDEPFSQLFTQTVRAAFAHRRKTMVNSFRDSGFLMPILQEAFDEARIDPKRRAETLTVQEFITLAKAIHLRSI